MEGNQDLHPVVQLLLKRMESHPEEFENIWEGRWALPLERIRDLLTPEEDAALLAKLRVIRLEAAHVWVLDELCNGEERRKEAERREEENRMMQHQQAAGLTTSKYAQAIPIGVTPQGVTGSGVSVANQITLGKETLDESTLSKIKRSIGL